MSTNTLRDEQNITQSQKMIIFILAMAVFGLAELVLEIVSDIEIGFVDLGISYFVFIPITLYLILKAMSIIIILKYSFLSSFDKS